MIVFVGAVENVSLAVYAIGILIKYTGEFASRVVSVLVIITVL
jgi:hypothetical protein